MKIKTKFFLFLITTVLVSLSLFVLLTLRIYSKDKIGFVKDKVEHETMTAARELGGIFKNSKNIGLTLNEPDTMDLFEKDDFSDKFLIDKEGKILFGTPELQGQSFASGKSTEALSKINKTDFASGLFEALDNKGVNLVISYANVPGTSDFYLLIFQPSQLNRFLYLFLLKVFFAFVGIGTFFFLAGYFAINAFTKSLDQLSQSAIQFGTGQYNHRIQIAGQDEVSEVAQQFNKMAVKIQDNIQIEKEKMRLQGEVQTAKKVQDMLFIASEFSSGPLQLSGHYEPASECGGDWWYYFAAADSVWVCIGDVTGHGVGSAMLTSSVRAALSLLEKQPGLTPALLLSQLNQVICETMGGKLNMTFCVLQFLLKEKKLIYANASHEFPMIMAKGQNLAKEQIHYLNGSNGFRLGQDLQAIYQDVEFILDAADFPRGHRVILFSDGVYDITNAEKKAYGERRFLKNLIAANATMDSTQSTLDHVLKDLQKWRGKEDLIDDVSLMCVDLNFAKPA